MKVRAWYCPLSLAIWSASRIGLFCHVCDKATIRPGGKLLFSGGTRIMHRFPTHRRIERPNVLKTLARKGGNAD